MHAKRSRRTKSERRFIIYLSVQMFLAYIYVIVKLFNELSTTVPQKDDITRVVLERRVIEMKMQERKLTSEGITTSSGDSSTKIVSNNNDEDFHGSQVLPEPFSSITPTSFPIEELARYNHFPQNINFVNFDNNKKGGNIDYSSLLRSNPQLELITHPAVELLPSLAKEIPATMVVPKFYDPPIFKQFGGIRSYLGNYGQQLMTLSQAKTIGSYVVAEAAAAQEQLYSAGSTDRGAIDDESISIEEEEEENGRDEDEQQSPTTPLLLETIFVAISSYRDFQCQQTVESLLSRATYPERIRVSVIDQLDFESDTPCSKPKVPCEDSPDQILCKYKEQLDFYEMDAGYAVGPVFARHLGNRMYRGEYFAMQCDAHVDFVKGWDVKTIQEWKSAKNEMAVLTTYLSDINGGMDEEGNLKRKVRPVMCRSNFEGNGVFSHLRHGKQPMGETFIKGEPTIEPYWAAGFSFSRGHFVINVPYDQHLPWVFQGEEISIGLRGFTYGYDYYAPQRSACFHYYAKEDKSGKRNKVKKFWENSSVFTRNDNAIKKMAMMRLNGILNTNPPFVRDEEWLHEGETFYGLGKVRSTQKFFKTFGIDIENQRVENHLCRFVGRDMQEMWKPHLRIDTMGFDYEQIDFQFKDPEFYGVTW